MQKIDDLIDSISIIKGNLSHIEKTGKINGTLRAEIKRIMLEYKDQLSERADTQETSDKHETEQLNILGVVRSLPEIKKRIEAIKAENEQCLLDYETANEKEQELIANKFVQLNLRIKELEWLIS